MKINDKRERGMQSFDSIHHVGTVFDYAGEFYMVIEDVKDKNNQYYNAVCLTEGELYCFSDESVLVLNDITLEID